MAEQEHLADMPGSAQSEGADLESAEESQTAAESEDAQDELTSAEPIDALAAEQRVKLEMQRRAGLTKKWTCHCMHVNDESIAMHWCEVCRGDSPCPVFSGGDAP